MEIAILVILAYITLFAAYYIGAKLSNRTGKGIFNVLAFLTQPLFIIGVAYLYKDILIYEFDFTDKRATEIMHYAGYWFLGVSVFFIFFVAFQSTHQTKSGRADKRYKDNPVIAGGPGCYLLALFIYVGSCVYAYQHFTGSNSDNKSEVKTQKYTKNKEKRSGEKEVKTSVPEKTHLTNTSTTAEFNQKVNTDQSIDMNTQSKQTEMSNAENIVRMPTYTPPEEKQQELKFNEGMAYFKADNGLYGYVNQSGSLVIDPQFKGAGGFYNGLAVVQTTDELWGYIDKQGNWAIRPSFCMAGRFSEGLAAVYVGGYKSGNECYDGKWGYITVTGKMAIEPRFDRAWYFSKDGKGIAKAKVELDGYTGYINGRGEWADVQSEQAPINNTENVINTPVKMPSYTPQPEAPTELKFNEGVAYFKANNGLYGFVNKVGSVVVEPKFKAAGGFYNGRAVVQTVDGLWGYIDKESNWIVKPQFCMAGRFSEGLAAVYVGGYKSVNECYGGKWGYITITGKMAIEPRFDRAWYFSKDGKGVAKAKVEQGSYTGYINGRGEWVD